MSRFIWVAVLAHVSAFVVGWILGDMLWRSWQ